MNTLLTFVLIASLSSDDYQTRETAEKNLASAPYRLVNDALVRATHPEARDRLHRVRSRIVIRDIDDLAGANGFPYSSSLGWPSLWSPAYEKSPNPDFYAAPWVYVTEHEYCGPHERPPKDYEEQDRTRAGLIAYVSRTGDWQYARRVLCPPTPTSSKPN